MIIFKIICAIILGLNILFLLNAVVGLQTTIYLAIGFIVGIVAGVVGLIALWCSGSGKGGSYF